MRSPDEFERAFSTMAKSRVDAVMATQDSIFNVNAKAIADLATKKRLPSSGTRDFAEAGGVIGYGWNVSHNSRRAAHFVDKILKGQARRPSRRAAYQVRAGHQPQDGEGTRAHDPAVCAHPRRPGHRVAHARPTRPAPWCCCRLRPAVPCSRMTEPCGHFAHGSIRATSTVRAKEISDEDASCTTSCCRVRTVNA